MVAEGASWREAEAAAVRSREGESEVGWWEVKVWDLGCW